MNLFLSFIVWIDFKVFNYRFNNGFVHLCSRSWKLEDHRPVGTCDMNKMQRARKLSTRYSAGHTTFCNSEPQNISKKSNLLWIILLINNKDHFRFRTKQKHHYLFIYFSLPVIFLHVNNADCRPSLHDELIRHTGFSQKLPSINW